jgi:hypothetical protein
MAGNKYIAMIAGLLTEVAASQTSAGAGDAGKIPALDAAGKLDTTFMPTGVGADTASITTSEALAAGDLVNIHNSTGAKARKADASVSGKEAHGSFCRRQAAVRQQRCTSREPTRRSRASRRECSSCLRQPPA